jgi:hypothetical protein
VLTCRAERTHEEKLAMIQKSFFLIQLLAFAVQTPSSMAAETVDIEFINNQPQRASASVGVTFWLSSSSYRNLAPGRRIRS